MQILVCVLPVSGVLFYFLFFFCVCLTSFIYYFFFSLMVWSGGAMVLGKLSVPGRPTKLDCSRTRASVLAVGANGSCLDICFSHMSFLIFLCLSGSRPDID